MSGIQATVLTVTLTTIVVGFIWALGMDLDPILIDEADPVDYEVAVGMTLPIRSIIVDDPDPVTVSVEDPEPFSQF